MTVSEWHFVSIDLPLYCGTAMIAHSTIALGQTLFHRYFGHHQFGRRFFKNHLHFHHTHYSDDHIVSAHYLKNEGNNTPFFLIPTTATIGLSYFVLRMDLFLIGLGAMSLSFLAHVYLDKQYHISRSWLGRFSWFRRKQQLHFVHHRHPDRNFAVIDLFWDRLFGTYRGIASDNTGHH